MKTIRIKVYSFNELSNEGKQKAIAQFSDINVIDSFWYESIYEDAKMIGLKIDSFEADRYCNGHFVLAANEVAQNIFNEHGKDCDTYKTAENFMNDWQPVFNEYMDESNENYESSNSEEKMIELEDTFLNSLCEDYRIILRNEYEYQTTDKAIIETIESNDYQFTKDGKQFN